MLRAYVRSWVRTFEVPSLVPISKPHPLLNEVQEQSGNGEGPIDHGQRLRPGVPPNRRSGAPPKSRFISTQCTGDGIADTGRPALSATHGEEPPRARNALEFVLTLILEPEVRTGNQVDNCPRHPNFTWLRAALHALS